MNKICNISAPVNKSIPIPTDNTNWKFHFLTTRQRKHIRQLLIAQTPAMFTLLSIIRKYLQILFKPFVLVDHLLKSVLQVIVKLRRETHKVSWSNVKTTQRQRYLSQHLATAAEELNEIYIQHGSSHTCTVFTYL